MSNIINAGKYNKKITIYKIQIDKDVRGFPIENRIIVLTPYASVKTVRGMTIIKNDSDFEKAYTNFTIRYPKAKIDREMKVEFSGKIYSIEYLNNVNEACVELEIQGKEVAH